MTEQEKADERLRTLRLQLKYTQKRENELEEAAAERERAQQEREKEGDGGHAAKVSQAYAGQWEQFAQRKTEWSTAKTSDRSPFHQASRQAKTKVGDKRPLEEAEKGAASSTKRNKTASELPRSSGRVNRRRPSRRR